MNILSIDPDSKHAHYAILTQKNSWYTGDVPSKNRKTLINGIRALIRVYNIGTVLIEGQFFNAYRYGKKDRGGNVAAFQVLVGITQLINGIVLIESIDSNRCITPIIYTPREWQRILLQSNERFKIKRAERKRRAMEIAKYELELDAVSEHIADAVCMLLYHQQMC